MRYLFTDGAGIYIDQGLFDNLAHAEKKREALENEHNIIVWMWKDANPMKIINSNRDFI